MELFCIFLMFALLAPFASSNPNEADFDAEDSKIEALLTKYDPDQNGFYTKENYGKLLVDMILSFENEQYITEIERQIISDVINEFVQKKGKTILSYEEVMKDLESEEIMQAVTKGMQEAAKNMDFLDEGKKMKKKGKNPRQKSKKTRKSKKNIKKNKAKMSCESNVEDDPNGQCTLPQKNDDISEFNEQATIRNEEIKELSKQEL